MATTTFRRSGLPGLVATAAQHVKDFGAAKGVVFRMTAPTALRLGVMTGLAGHVHLVLIVVETHCSVAIGQIKRRTLRHPQ